jgi:hypothetical protein
MDNVLMKDGARQHRLSPDATLRRSPHGHRPMQLRASYFNKGLPQALMAVDELAGHAETPVIFVLSAYRYDETVSLSSLATDIASV